MWAVLKFNQNELSLFKREVQNIFGNDYKIYIPKILIEKYKNKKLIKKEFCILGDYLFFFHSSLSKEQSTNTFKFLKGVKYFLKGFVSSQKDIKKFIEKCKKLECKNGYLSKNFFDLEISKEYKFDSGPFVDRIFKIINLQKNKIKILIGDLETTFKDKSFLYSAI